ncbi:predicted protein [Phaeodactylum tricornutum CCAP 1055/1]|jgi:amino acid permease|uniref:Amino acid transporter transmembrane domain-containing protein n=1 Tax=Phaeodactylum tricornutum (strain CCAP 1055/1) TaxID=556484 RepID=B7S418_PHATC|nr:predicted protein [Phaeodactylum tricornutum CCAP 1055/1]EEC42689.1 predicted protein [Phaeodactylum tricornutum CCAP 1055/1]|eukprot:XP_002176297.1 predicted protein [Phaeodactylum tricornutum CCAP 1055/1]
MQRPFLLALLVSCCWCSVAATLPPQQPSSSISKSSNGSFGPIFARRGSPSRTGVTVSEGTLSIRGGAIKPRFGNNHKSTKVVVSAGPRTKLQQQKRNNQKIPEGTSTMSAQVFNLIKSIVGAGVLGLPAGIAAFGDAPSAIIPALALLPIMAFLAANGFSTIGVVCAETQTMTYRDAWSATVGPGTSWMPAAACLMVTTCSVLCYSMVLADTMPSILKATTGIALARTPTLLTLTATVILPLCLLRNLSSLAPFSLVGILGMLYTAVVMAVRWQQGAYSLPNGLFANEIVKSYQPAFGTTGMWQAVASPKVTIWISMLSTAFMAHYLAPSFYWDLKQNTMQRFNTMIGLSFTGAVALMALTAVAGFATFGISSASLILNNYAVNDALLSFSRLAVALSLIFSYPLAFKGVKDGVMDLAKVPVERRAKISDGLTVALLIGITSLALVLTDIRLILSLGGATWGNCVIYIFPSLMLFKAANTRPWLQAKRAQAVLTGLLGLVLGVLGTKQALVAA